MNSDKREAISNKITYASLNCYIPILHLVRKLECMYSSLQLGLIPGKNPAYLPARNNPPAVGFSE